MPSAAWTTPVTGSEPPTTTRWLGTDRPTVATAGGSIGTRARAAAWRRVGSRRTAYTLRRGGVGTWKPTEPLGSSRPRWARTSRWWTQRSSSTRSPGRPPSVPVVMRVVAPPMSAVVDRVGTIRTRHTVLWTWGTVRQRNLAERVTGGVVTEAAPVASVVAVVTGRQWRGRRTWRTTC